MVVKPGQKLLMIGDSITDTDRARPAGEGKMDSLGAGYVSIVAGFLHARYPEGHYRVVNMGISGNTVRELKERWQNDVIDRAPDWLSVMIGINDVGRHFNRPYMSEVHVGLEEFEGMLVELIGETLPSLDGLVLATPYFLEPNRADPIRAMMDRYGDVVRSLAAEYGAILVDTQSAFDAYLAHNHPMTISTDRVHVNRTGHVIIARAFLRALGFEW